MTREELLAQLRNLEVSFSMDKDSIYGDMALALQSGDREQACIRFGELLSVHSFLKSFRELLDESRKEP